MIGEVLDLSGGFVVALLPFIVLSVPGIVLFVLLPAVLLLALALPLAVIGAVLAGPPYLFLRWRRRRRRPSSGESTPSMTSATTLSGRARTRRGDAPSSARGRRRGRVAAPSPPVGRGR